MSDNVSVTSKDDRDAARRYSRRSRALRKLRRDKLHMLVLVSIGLLLIVALFADVIAPHDPRAFVGVPLEGPSRQLLLGADEIGRDVFSRIIHGSRVSLYVGFFATMIAVVVGMPMGLASGYYGGWFDTLMMRITDGLLAFPPIILAMATVAVLGPSLRNTIIAIGVVQIPRFSRLLRAMALSIKEQEYVSAARVLGAGNAYIIARSVAPNSLRVVLVQFSLTFATAVITEAALSFLGLGAQPPLPSWGLMLNIGRQVMSANAIYPLAAGIAIFITVLLFTLLGDALSDILDPYRSS